MKKNKKKEQEEVMDNQTEDTQSQADETSAEKAEVNWQEKAAELNDKYLRLYSEFDNFRRRTAKERIDLIKSASKEILEDLLPVVDDFDRTIDSLTKTADLNAFGEGVKLVQHKFLGVLQKQGLQHFEATGEAFDAELHEAITKIPAPTEDLKGKVVDVIEKGYMLNDKVLRYAKVVVGE
ncbi:MAG: nucleotide exchange factor GrpE [Flavobacteriales bacterium]|nr:nucleotide exchange factor GrpE [Flavobacteriales bacterium]